MPTYLYECADCRNRFEQFQKFSEDALTTCPTCEGVLRRVIQNVGVVFKGSGWYITDSRGSSKEKSTGETATVDKPDKADKPDKDSKVPTKTEKSEKPAKAESGSSPAPAPTPQ